MRAHFSKLATAAMLAVAITAMVIPATSAATPTIHFSVRLGNPESCLTLWSTPNQTAHLVWRDADGNLKADASNFTDNGLWFYCPGNVTAQIGDRLKLTDETSSRTFVVPNLTINLDRVTDTYYGTGPANRTVRIEVAHGDVGRSKGARVGDDGTWSLHTDNWSIFGGDYAGLSWKSTHGDQVFTGGIAPFLIVTLDKSAFSGWAIPGQEIDVALDGAVDAAGSATASAAGDFAGKFRDAGHHLRPAAPGDHLTSPSLASDADWIVPEIDGSADAASDIVQAQCHENGTFNDVIVELFRDGVQRGLAYIGHNPGAFQFNFRKVGNFFANPANVKPGDQIRIECRQTTGDIAQLQFIVP